MYLRPSRSEAAGRQGGGIGGSVFAALRIKCGGKNYCYRQGEIDLVCRDGPALVFVEVRLRRSKGFGGPEESVTRQKQRRIILAAQHYLAKLSSLPPCRFDAVLFSSTEPEAMIEWVRDAFTA